MINIYYLNNRITLISGGDFSVNISAGYIDTPVGGEKRMSLWASHWFIQKRCLRKQHTEVGRQQGTSSDRFLKAAYKYPFLRSILWHLS